MISRYEDHLFFFPLMHISSSSARKFVPSSNQSKSNAQPSTRDPGTARTRLVTETPQRKPAKIGIIVFFILKSSGFFGASLVCLVCLLLSIVEEHRPSWAAVFPLDLDTDRKSVFFKKRRKKKV